MNMKPITSVRHLLAALARKFSRDEDASLSVEAVLVIPLLLWAFLASFTVFDMFRDRNLAVKANHAVSDLLSREVNPIDSNYLNGVDKVFKYLTRSNGASWMRVTSVYCDKDCDKATRRLKRHWSKATGGQPSLSNAGVRDELGPIVPWIAAGDQLVVVETSIEYTPPFSKKLTGFGGRVFHDTVMTPPRFSQLCWQSLPPC